MDLRAVNQAVIPGRHPLPTAEDITVEFHGSNMFSKLDSKQGYLQLPMAEDAQYITASVTHMAVFQFRQMPFGLSSAPSASQKMMTSVLAGIPGVAIYMDDIAVHGLDRKTHNERLDHVFQRLACHQLTVNNEKCLIGVAEIPFVGHYVSSKGIAPLSSNVEAILRLPPPESVSDLSTFLGMTNYYLCFLEDYARTSEPLRCLLKKGVPWVWSTECQSAFHRLKQHITSAPILAHFSSEATTFVTGDASATAIGAVLSQEQEGVERPVAFVSRVFSSAEQKYSAGKERHLHVCGHVRSGTCTYMGGSFDYELTTRHLFLSCRSQERATGHYGFIVGQRDCVDIHFKWSIGQ